MLQKLIVTNLDRCKMTMTNFWYDYANNFTNGGEMMLMVLSQMFDLPVTIITPNYIWATHDIDVVTIPIVIIHDHTGKWHATCKFN